MWKLKKRQSQKSQNQNQTQNNQETIKKRHISKQNVTTLVATTLLVLAHIVVILAIAFSFRYYAIYPSLFGSIVCIVVCLLIIIDIIFFVGFNHKDLALKITSCVLALLILIGGTVGTVLLNKTNNIVDSVLDDGSDKYETYSGVFVSYDKYNSFTSIEELSGKKIGMLAETSDGISSIAKEILDDAKIDYAVIDYKTNAELLTALVDNEVDAVVITSAYRSIYSLERDENSPFAEYLDNFVDFNSFEKELKVKTNKKTKNLSTEPFNILLIGYSRTDIGSSVGLADSIIVATVNPQTYTVSMMSIARDSFVPIACYGGEYDKINSGRSTSRACFIETVEDFLGMDIDYYMELDYLGLVQIVNTIGGVKITNPVEFTLDGIYVPEGTFLADGQQALQFCRERHHMPNGDFDRQQHQKEVIIAIAKKFIESGSVSLALEAMESASDWMSTDLTLNQLTTVFNLLLNTKNYTSLKTFDLVDFQTLRITGSGGIMYYSYSMRLPLWVYLIYQGSYDESISHIKDVMGEYTSISQDSNFEFSTMNLYERPAFYSESYPDEFMYTPDPMPAYWASLSGMSVSEAMAWANENGVSLSISETITADDSRYDAEYEGLVYEQSVRYGALISEYSSGTITVMGSSEIDESKVVPNFVGRSYSKAKKWANTYDIYCDITFSTTVEGEVGKVVEQSPKAYTNIEDCDALYIVVKAGQYKIKFSSARGTVPSSITVTTGDKEVEFDDLDNEGLYIFKGWYTSAGSDGKKVESTDDVSGRDGETITLYAKWTQLYNVTFVSDGTTYATKISTEDFPSNPTKNGYIFDGWYSGSTKITSMDSIKQDTTLTAKWNECTHTWDAGVEKTPATCEGTGIKMYTCTQCGETKEETINSLGHDYQNVDQVDATCTSKGTTAGSKCTRCGKVESGCEPIAQLTGDACNLTSPTSTTPTPTPTSTTPGEGEN
jgi:polyisoprenyl-teichoic acid--peptidoglycan teichoic acid transferase